MSKFNLCVLSIAMFGLPCLGHAEDWTTEDGKSYKNVNVVSSDSATVTILDSDGGAKIQLSALSPELQKKFNYDPAAVKAAQEAALDKEIKAGEDNVRSSIRTVNEVSSNQSEFVGKPFYFQGKIDLSTYYNYGYEKAQTTHYSFKFKDSDGGTATLYMARGKDADNLRARILREQQPVSGLFLVVIPPERFDKEAGGLLVEMKSAIFGGD